MLRDTVPGPDAVRRALRVRLPRVCMVPGLRTAVRIHAIADTGKRSLREMPGHRFLIELAPPGVCVPRPPVRTPYMPLRLQKGRPAF